MRFFDIALVMDPDDPFFQEQSAKVFNLEGWGTALRRLRGLDLSKEEIAVLQALALFMAGQCYGFFMF